MHNKVIEIKELRKSFSTRYKKLEILNGVNYEFQTGKFYAIMGHSGSGKSTLINILGLIMGYDSGEYYLFDKNTKNLSDKDLSYLRMKNIGFVFQDYNLDIYLKAYENVMLPMLINKDLPTSKRKERAFELLKLVKLEDRTKHYPRELSGGEQQRVGIARALSNDPEIILADEPTGNLDVENEKLIFQLLKSLADLGKCVIVVSHTTDIKQYADVILNLHNGVLTDEK